MKKVIVIGFSVNALLLAGILLKDEVFVHAAGECGTPKGNGDVNADGAIDISDAVHLLNWLFLGGPAPVPTRLPATGQTKCYDSAGAEIPCDDSNHPGQDGFYQAGCPMEKRFVDNLDGTVTDTCTGLMWQKETADVNEDGVVGDAVIWRDALEYCEGLSFAGHDDWHLPNAQELQSIVDYGGSVPTIDPVFGALPSHYWSSSTAAGNRSNVWGVHLGWDNGYFEKDEHNPVRAVRSRP